MLDKSTPCFPFDVLFTLQSLRIDLVLSRRLLLTSSVVKFRTLPGVTVQMKINAAVFPTFPAHSGSGIEFTKLARLVLKHQLKFGRREIMV